MPIKWVKSRNENEWRLYENPFTLWVFLDDDGADCVARCGHETKTQVVVGVDGNSNLQAGKEWCLDWARKKISGLNEDFNIKGDVGGFRIDPNCPFCKQPLKPIMNEEMQGKTPVLDKEIDMKPEETETVDRLLNEICELATDANHRHVPYKLDQLEMAKAVIVNAEAKLDQIAALALAALGDK